MIWFLKNFFVSNWILWAICGAIMALGYIALVVILSAMPIKERKRFIKNVMKFGRR